MINFRASIVEACHVQPHSGSALQCISLFGVHVVHGELVHNETPRVASLVSHAKCAECETKPSYYSKLRFIILCIV